MSVVGMRYTLINVCVELSGDKVTSIVFHGYREVVSPRAKAVAVASFGRRYTVINVCEELSGDKVTIIVFHGH